MLFNGEKRKEKNSKKNWSKKVILPLGKKEKNKGD